MTTRQWKRDQARRSSRAGTVVMIVFVSAPAAIVDSLRKAPSASKDHPDPLTNMPGVTE